jgi:hypothetical protein
MWGLSPSAPQSYRMPPSPSIGWHAFNYPIIILISSPITLGGSIAAITEYNIVYYLFPITSSSDPLYYRRDGGCPIILIIDDIVVCNCFNVP